MNRVSQIGAETDIVGIAVVLYALVACGEFCNHLRCVVAGRVVVHADNEVRISLIEHTLNSAS